MNSLFGSSIRQYRITVSAPLLEYNRFSSSPFGIFIQINFLYSHKLRPSAPLFSEYTAYFNKLLVSAMDTLCFSSLNENTPPSSRRLEMLSDSICRLKRFVTSARVWENLAPLLKVLQAFVHLQERLYTSAIQWNRFPALTILGQKLPVWVKWAQYQN